MIRFYRFIVSSMTEKPPFRTAAFPGESQAAEYIYTLQSSFRSPTRKPITVAPDTESEFALPEEGHHAPILVTGFHGCTREAAEAIYGENRFIPSAKNYDWLGNGIYFWEYGPKRAEEWAQWVCDRKKSGSQPAVVRATIRLGQCLNLLDTEHHDRIEAFYLDRVRSFEAEGLALPKNEGEWENRLDRFILNKYCEFTAEERGFPFQTVRGCFPEGRPIFEGSKILGKTHVQIAVRDAACISNVSIL